jgi:DNA repair exonuclease SbcCD ATPase subunit
MEIRELQEKVQKLKGKKESVQSQIASLKTEIKEKQKSLVQHEKAREIIREVGMKTQQQLQFHISDITSLALESVFPDPYELAVEFVQRRNKTECDLYFVRDGKKVDPMTASGVGAVDVAAFALRIAAWSMQTPRTRATILLDEPFKHLKGLEPNKRVLEMIQEISKRMGIQVIMVSDERIPREDIIDAADRVFEVKMKNRVSKVTTI